ncbi:diguanylate cyclase (GGDEF)-like protein/PAS domain S-box-containing protein [Vogesella perlucida]|nr:diguanylate cyclase (GGDEF)-like protein/PAS domain S-box-containing protein [Vogesella perlucida]
MTQTTGRGEVDKNTLGALVALCFFVAGIAFWPVQWLDGMPLAAFVAHGMMAWRFAAGRLGMVWWWSLPVVLVSAWLMPYPEALLWSLSFVAMLLGLSRILPPADFRLDSVRALLSLQWRSTLPALMLVAPLAAALPPGQWPQLLQAFLLAWLTLAAILPLAYVAFPSPLMRRDTLWLMLASALAVAVLWLLGRQACQTSCLIVLLPLLFIAALRGGMSGVAGVGVVLLLLLSVPGVWLGKPWPALQGLPATLALVLFTLLASLVAVFGDGYRRRERLLQDVQARFESLLNQSTSLMTLKDLDGRYLVVNLNFARLFGHSPLYFKGRSARDVYTADEAKAITEHDQQVLRSLESRQFEENITVDGASLRMLSSVFPLFDSEGLPSGVGSISVDITERAAEERQRQEAVEKYRAVVEQSLVGIYITQEEELVYVNPKLADLVQYTTDELVGRSIVSVLPPGEAARIRAQIRRRIADTIQNMHYTTRLLRKDGEIVDVEIHSRLFDYQGRKALIGVVMDISDRVAASAELRLAATVFDNATEGILVTDAEGRIVMVNQAFTRITGFGADEAIGRVSRMLRTANRERNRALIEALARDGHWKGEMFDRHKNGDPYVAELSISAVRSPNGALTHYVGVFSDITGRKQAEDRLQFLASHDPLTRLPNRSALIEAIDNTIIESSHEVPQLAVMFIDLDRFKLINDSFGHQAGDEVLHEIAARLTQSAQRFGLVARLGGDEFTLLVRDFDSHETLGRMAEEVLAALARPMRVEQHEVFVSGSIGISVYPNDGIDANTLLKNADAAMYRAKEAGKNTYQFFDAEMNIQTFERLLMESGLRQALERGEFELHYQPQVSCDGVTLEGVEALIRWRHPQLGLIAPVRFIPLAEETGLIKPIGAWVLREACHQMVAWDVAGLVVPRLAVNLSARQFEQQTLLTEVNDVLAATGLQPARLELEITESMLMQNPQEAVLLLGELKALGVKLSIDDFGTGYSSLSTLKRFPLDYLKVDRSFIEGLPADEDSAAITEAIIAMARKLHFTVIAEGVETAAQGAFLRHAGCAILQGYFFSKPLPADQLAQWLAARQQPVPLLAEGDDEL